jgi:hypothetical protein
MILDALRWLRWKIDVLTGHGAWLPDTLCVWWYFHICSPSGIWECRDLPDLEP